MKSHTVLLRALLAVLLTYGAMTRGAQETVKTNDPVSQETSEAFLTDTFSYRYGCYRRQIILDGEWQFRRDKVNQGKELGFHQGREEFNQRIKIPGVPQAKGLGETNRSQKWFLNEPFWVRRTFKLPDAPSDKRVWLRIGGILPAGEIYLNGTCLGFTKSSRTQQRVDVTRLVQSAGENLIAIKVCDWPKVKLEGIWEMSELQRLWTGVYRSIRLEITDLLSVVDAYVQSDLASSSASVSFELTDPAPAGVFVRFVVRDGREELGTARLQIPEGAKTAMGKVELAKFTPWSPNHPKLYLLDISLHHGLQQAAFDKVGVRFGMREIATKSARFYLNGQPIYLRCFGDDQLYLDTLAPPADVNWYLPRLKRAREYGLNAAKSCEEIFSQDYLEAADEAGIMIIQEMPFGLSGYVRTTQHKLEEPWRKFYAKEFVGLCKESRNNASVIAYSMCSEVPLDSGSPEAFNFFVRELPARSKELAPHTLVIDNTGWLGTTKTPMGYRMSDFYAVVIPTWMKEVLNETPIKTDGLRPNLLHEYNWWSCYPDPASRKKYKNTAVFPWWLDVLEKSVREKGQAEMVPAYVRNSLALQALCRKDGIEYARRCPNVEGFILWLLIDFGQYTEGLLDDFWMPKNVMPREFLKSTADTTILLAQDGDRSLHQGSATAVPIAISHYGEKMLSNYKLKWQVDGPGFRKKGELLIPRLIPGELTQAGAVRFTPPIAVAADARRWDLGHTARRPPPHVGGYRLELRTSLFHGPMLVNINNWSFWAFPEPPKLSVDTKVLMRVDPKNPVTIPAGTPLVVAGFVDQALVDYVSAGGNCLLLSHGTQIENTNKYAGSTTFHTTYRTIPWNAGPGNSGTVIADHPALNSFPHDNWCDLQFVYLIRDALPIEFTPLKAYGVKPIVRGIDWYQTNRDNAYLVEFCVGQGKVLATSFHILPRTKDHLEVRDFLSRLVNYTLGDQFCPSAKVPAAEFLKLFSARPE
jgi:beta-galactosidase